VQDVFFGGTDTSYTVLEFAMVELVRNPGVMSTLREELRSAVPAGEAMLSEADVTGLPYLRAVIKETLRLHPPAPLLAPHYSMSEVHVGSYKVPAQVAILVNAWAIGRDPSLWEHADQFLPERFLLGSDDGAAAVSSFRGTDYKFVPFGAGRRMCPGIAFSVSSNEGMLANLVYQFNWEVPRETAGIDDMEELFCLTLTRKAKLILVPTVAAA
jgi:cytochrome P450